MACCHTADAWCLQIDHRTLRVCGVRPRFLRAFELTAGASLEVLDEDDNDDLITVARRLNESKIGSLFQLDGWRCGAAAIQGVVAAYQVDGLTSEATDVFLFERGVQQPVE